MQTTWSGAEAAAQAGGTCVDTGCLETTGQAVRAACANAVDAAAGAGHAGLAGAGGTDRRARWFVPARYVRTVAARLAGQLAVHHTTRHFRLATALGIGFAAAALSGCQSLYSEGATAGAGIAGAAVAGSITNNAAVATGIGLGAVAAARAGVQYSERVIHRHTQDGIAQVAGPLDVGGVAPWSVSHSVPLEEDEHGRVTVSRVISSGLLECKEIVFTVDKPATDKAPATSAYFVASICRDGNLWKWASAEPATERWGALQ
jgi:hypothetical protein